MVISLLIFETAPVRQNFAYKKRSLRNGRRILFFYVYFCP